MIAVLILTLIAILAPGDGLTAAQRNCMTDTECEAAYGFDMYGNDLEE